MPPKKHTEPVDGLIEEAVDLIMLMQDRSGDPHVLESIRLWRGASAQHEEAWRRVAHIHDASGLLLEARQRDERRESLLPSRRNFLFGGLALTGAGIWGYEAVPDLLLRMQADYTTPKGQMQQLALPGGARATLGPDSALALRSGGQQQRLELLSGMAFVDYAGPRSDGLRISAAGVDLTTEEAKLDLSLDAGSVYLQVASGRVLLSRSGVTSGTVATLGAGQWLAYDPRSGGLERGQRAVDEIAHWRDRQLIAHHDPVGVLINRIDRWHTGRIIQVNPGMNAIRISGFFDLTDPVTALSAVVRSAGGHLRELPGGLVVISSV